MHRVLPVRDSELIQIVDAALSDAVRRSAKPDGTSWLACRPGCTSCCHGVFRISALDAERLKAGLRLLQVQAPSRAEAIRSRAQAVIESLRSSFPGDVESGELAPEADGTWETFSDLPEADAACPVLDPVSGRCELYRYRPLTCRVFGPPVQNDTGIGICELCYVGASVSEILAGEMILQHDSLEAELSRDLPATETVVAWALLQL